MSDTVIRVENLSKQYRLGEVGTGTISHDLNRWWAKVRGKEDPFSKLGETNDRTKKGNSEYVWALRDINFEVKQGEVLGIIGRNGAGKSTLLKLLSKVTSPTTGSIKMKGRVASLLEVGTGFHPELTGRENVFLNGAILGMTKKEIEKKFDEIVDFAGVERFIDTPVKRYSSGMYVRLAFAVAAHLEPEILIVDEVLAVGDAEFQKKCLGKMNQVSREEGRTILFVSHNLKAVAALCKTGLFLYKGEAKFIGKVDEVLENYVKSSTYGKGGIINKISQGIIWEGILNTEYLNNLSPIDDIKFLFGIRSVNQEYNNVFMDLALYNQRDEIIIHTKAKYISKGVILKRDRLTKIEYTLKSPRLSPGQYYLTVFLYSPGLENQILLWVNNLPACLINSQNIYNTEQEVDDIILNDVKSAILINYDIKSYDD
ncbi:MAG: ABC transporter ATP-binding protein [Chitinophagaceae bacterium]|nr:MAG: ABC transporter ATP-binding protein [Chitinophagaceae bacterium]